jgi:hypothetical protein
VKAIATQAAPKWEEAHPVPVPLHLDERHRPVLQVDRPEDEVQQADGDAHEADTGLRAEGTTRPAAFQSR